MTRLPQPWLGRTACLNLCCAVSIFIRGGVARIADPHTCIAARQKQKQRKVHLVITKKVAAFFGLFFGLLVAADCLGVKHFVDVP